MSVPAFVNPNLLQNGTLLTPDQVQKVRDFFKNNPKETLFKGSNNIQYPVLRTEQGQLLALYSDPQNLVKPPEQLNSLKTDVKTQKATDPNKPYPLGIGRDGVVVGAQSLEDGSWCAAKFETFNAFEDEVRIASINMEQTALKTQQDTFKGSATLKTPLREPGKNGSEVTNNVTTVVTAMKLGPGKDLNEAMVDDQGVNNLSLEQKLDIALKVATATAQLSQNNMVHRDFKPNNIMANPATGEVMLIDFGGAGTLDQNGEFKEESFIGTAGYDAPELATGSFGVEKRTQSENAMVFSLGMCFAEIFTKNNLREPNPKWQSDYVNPPLPALGYSSMLGCFSDVLSDKPEIRSKKNIVEREMANVALKLLHLDPCQRISCSLAANELQVIKQYHDFLKANNIPLDNMNAKTMLEHMEMLKLTHASDTVFTKKISQLEGDLNQCRQQQGDYQRGLFEKRLDQYLKNPLPSDVADPSFKAHHKQMVQYQNELKGLDRNAKNYAQQFNIIKDKVYSEKSMYEINLLYVELKNDSKLLNKMTGKAICSDLNKKLAELDKQMSREGMTPADVSKLYNKVAEVKTAFFSARAKTDDEVKNNTKDMLKNLTGMEKRMNIYRDLQSLSPRSEVPVRVKEKNAILNKINSWFEKIIPTPKAATNISKPLPIAVPTQPIAVPTQPIAVPPQPIAVPTQPIAVPTQPIAVSTQPIAVSTPTPPIATPLPTNKVPTLIDGNFKETQLKGKIKFILNYVDKMEKLKNLPQGQEAMQQNREDLKKYTQDADPMVKALALAMQANLNKENDVFKSHMQEFGKFAASRYGSVTQFNKEFNVNAAAASANNTTQLAFNHNQQAPTKDLRKLAQDNNSKLSDKQLDDCRKNMGAFISSGNLENVKDSNKFGAPKVMDYVKSALSAKSLSLGELTSLHDQTKHIWKDEAKSPLAVAIKEKNTELAVTNKENIQNIPTTTLKK